MVGMKYLFGKPVTLKLLSLALHMRMHSMWKVLPHFMLLIMVRLKLQNNATLAEQMDITRGYLDTIAFFRNGCLLKRSLKKWPVDAFPMGTCETCYKSVHAVILVESSS